MKKGYSAIKSFFQTYEAAFAVWSVTAVYASMFLAEFFWVFQFHNADLKDIAACEMWDKKTSIQAIILFFVIAVMLAFLFCCTHFFIYQKHIQEDKVLVDRKKTRSFFQIYIGELIGAYALGVNEAMLVFHFLRGQFLNVNTNILDLIAYRQYIFDNHIKIFCVCNITLLCLFLPNFILMVKLRRNENIINIIHETKKRQEKTKEKS